MIETSKNMNDLITLLSRVKRHFQFSLNCYKRQGRRGRWGVVWGDYNMRPISEAKPAWCLVLL